MKKDFTTPYWWEEAPPKNFHVENWPALMDVVIIGGGFTGFGAAIKIAKAGLDVMILERDRVGEGASTRNGGITSGNLRLSFDTLRKRFGLQQAEAFFLEAKAAREDLFAFIRTEEIDCDLQPSGRFVGTTHLKALDGMKRDADHLSKLLDIKVTVHDSNTVPNHIDSKRYCGGMWRDDISGIHPAKLLNGMVKVAKKAGVKIASQTQVLSVSREESVQDYPFELSTSRGLISAGHVISATNAYTDKTQPWLRRRLVPVISEMIATENIGENMVRSLMPSLSMHSELLELGFYFRPAPDRKRILLGGRRLNSNPSMARRRLKDGLISIFPQLKEIGLSHHWFGFVAFPFDQLPKLVVHDGIIYPCGYCGSGTVWARWLGQKAAQMVLGDLEPNIFQGKPFRTIPFYTGDPWFLPLAMKIYELKDRFTTLKK